MMALKVPYVWEKFFRFNVYSAHYGRKLLLRTPFLMPHDKSYYGFTHFANGKGGLILDIGANDGISAIGLRKILPHHQIISFEPNPFFKRKLERLKSKIKDFSFYSLGVGDESAKAMLNIPFLGDIPLPTAASLHRNFVNAGMVEAYGDLNDSKVRFVQQEVSLVRIDELNLDADMVKLDTEGHDLSCLKGMPRMIARCRPVILMEFIDHLFDEETELLRQYDYDFYSYDYGRRHFAVYDRAHEKERLRRTKIYHNVFCIPREKLDYIQGADFK